MTETCLLMAPFLKGLNCCLRGPSPPLTLLAPGLQVDLSLDTVSNSLHQFWCVTWKVFWPLCRSGPTGGSTTDHRDSDVPGRADTLWDFDPTLLSHSSPVLGGGAAGATTATPPTAPSSAAPWRCSPAHTYLETSKWQVAVLIICTIMSELVAL